MLIVHRSERADYLVEALGDVLVQPLADPVAREIVAVPTRGVERWLTQRLSHRLGVSADRADGVCANVDFPFPGTLVASVLSTVTGHDPVEDPWAPERAVWPLIEVIDEHAEDPRLTRLAGHLRAASPTSTHTRRFAMARHLADLFDRYSVHRPAMLQVWVQGRLGRAGGDGTEEWQAYLWRLLRQRIGVPSPAERLAGAVQSVTATPGILDFPERLCVFGLTRLPASHLEVLVAVAEEREVHLFLLHPSAALWDRTAALAPHPVPGLRRQDDPSVRAAANPLLRAWGRDAREMQLVLSARGIAAGVLHPVEEAGEPTLLRRIQADIRGDRVPGSAPAVVSGDDRSLRVHACHGRARQVEVLRDAILHLLADDPTLELRDVIVMCPDIDAFAPLIHAAFGAGSDPSESDRGLPPLRVRLADRSIRQTNPLLAVAGELLELAGSRATATQVLDLASLPAVARRFGFDQDDLSSIERWVAGSGVRWGFDADHRRGWSLGDLAANTWCAGLDRLALGVAMEDSAARLFGGVVPFDGSAGTHVELSGRLTELVHRLELAVARLTGPQPAGAWVEALVEATESVACSPAEAWQHDQLRLVLGQAADEAGPDGPLLALDEAKTLLASRLRGQPTRANFRTGDLTVCTLVPMRSVPHRVVALLGLDDGAFPRQVDVDGDDLLLAEPEVGDRDARSEDRQLLLDAVLAATDHLLITYSGRDDRSNRPLPPCAPVADLLDVVDATARCADGRPGSETVVVHHPLQPFDRRNFVPAALDGAAPWSFDRVFLAGARSVVDQVAPPPWVGEDLPPLDEPVVHLDDLVSFVKHPVRAFFRRRLLWYLSGGDTEVEDSIPVDVDALAQWGVGDRFLQAYLAGEDLDLVAGAELARGVLPPAALGAKVLAEVRGGVEDLAAGIAAAGFGPGESRALDVRVELPDGRVVMGMVPNVRAGAILQCTYSRLAPKHRLEAWVRFLAVTADRPELGLAAVSIGRGERRGNPVAVSRFAFPEADPAVRAARARAELGRLVQLYDKGMARPLPLAVVTSHEWASATYHGADTADRVTRTRERWEGGFSFPGEAADPEHVVAFGEASELAVLLREPPTPDERDRFPGEGNRFEALARWLWAPVLHFEQRS